MAPQTKRCYRCDIELPDEKARLYSSWTGHYYCVDLDGCQKRFERRLELDAVFAAEQAQLRAERNARIDDWHNRPKRERRKLAVASPEKKKR